MAKTILLYFGLVLCGLVLCGLIQGIVSLV